MYYVETTVFALELCLVTHLKVDKLTILPPEGLPLPDNNSGHHLEIIMISIFKVTIINNDHLLAELRLPLLDGGEDHVPATGGWQPGNTIIT